MQFCEFLEMVATKVTINPKHLLWPAEEKNSIEFQHEIGASLHFICLRDLLAEITIGIFHNNF